MFHLQNLCWILTLRVIDPSSRHVIGNNYNTRVIPGFHSATSQRAASQTGCWISDSVQPRPPETSWEILFPQHPPTAGTVYKNTVLQTGWGQNSQESRMWSTILPGFGPDLFPLHGCLAPAGHRALVSLSVALHPTLTGVEVTTTGMTSYVNVCRPESTKRTAKLPSSSRLRESRHEQTVKYYPGKPVIATSSSIWHSVVKLRTWRETKMLPGWKMCL